MQPVSERFDVSPTNKLFGFAVRPPVQTGAVAVAQLAVVYVCGALQAPATPVASSDAAYQVTFVFSTNPQEYPV